MKNKNFDSLTVKIGGGVLAGMMTPAIAHACACGCGVFDVATSSMFPQGAGGMAWVQYDYMNQNRNWDGSAPAPSTDNSDKRLETHFITAGAQYMFNTRWGAQVEIPYDFRHFTGTDEQGHVRSDDWSQLGDIRLEGIYSGFFADQSAGVTFGVKLPTGSISEDTDLVDRDTQLGTGSTDALIGGFWRGNFDSDQKWDWFVQGSLDVPTLISGGYRPGLEFDGAAGIDYKGFSIGRTRISPLLQAIFSDRMHDSGPDSDQENTGYYRVLLSPGIEFHIHPVKVYADVEIPIIQHFKGDQLAAPALFKVSVSYMF